MRMSVICLASAFAAIGSFGCIVERREPRRVVVEERPGPEVAVVEGPGIYVVEVEPAPVERVYIYDPGYPPGCYIYGGFYYYGGHRYEHDVFMDRIVRENIRRGRFMHAEENRQHGERIERQHRETYARTHGDARERQRSRQEPQKRQEESQRRRRED